jgi:hypothetical protein
MSKKNNNEVRNIYKKIPKKLLPSYHNPNYDNHLLNIPFRCVIVGSSGSGKTNVAVEILRRMNDTFGKIWVVTKNKDEPIYNFLQSMIPPDFLDIREGVENIPEFDEFDPELQHMVIFDDLVLEKNQKKIEQYFIRGRKIARGISCLYLTQSFYKTPKVIRLNSSYIILKKLSSKRDLNLILSEVNIGINKNKLFELYKYCIDGDFTNFLLIDCDAPQEKKFRKNFLEILETEEE